MNHVSIYVDQIKLFVIVNNDRIKINVDVNVKNQLIKECVIKDLFGIRIIVNVNVINLVILVDIQIIQIADIEKKIVDPLVEECTENINETKLVNITAENENKDKCNSYVVYKMLFFIFFVIIIVIGIYFVYHKYVNRIKYDLPY